MRYRLINFVQVMELSLKCNKNMFINPLTKTFVFVQNIEIKKNCNDCICCDFYKCLCSFSAAIKPQYTVHIRPTPAKFSRWSLKTSVIIFAHKLPWLDLFADKPPYHASPDMKTQHPRRVDSILQICWLVRMAYIELFVFLFNIGFINIRGQCTLH